jgi:hypothetical protein
MQIREYQDSDLDALRTIHTSQGFDYAFPDLRNPLFVTKLVLTDDVAPPLPAQAGFRAASSSPAEGSVSGDAALEPVATRGATGDDENSRAGNCDAAKLSAGSPIFGAALLRLTAEAYLLLDPRAGTPRERWQWLLALHAAAERDAWQRGLEDVHAWLPPGIAQKFGRRITQLGWRRDDAWTPYCKRLAAPCQR